MAQAKIAARCHGVDVPASPFLNETRTARIAAERYERQEIAGALEVVQPDDIVLEMGAGLGIVGAVTAKNSTPKKVYSFEANPDLLPHIQALYQANGLDDKIEVQNRILLSGADQPKTVTFHRHNSFLGSSLVARPGRKTRTVDVPTRDFDAVLDETGATVLLIDIEGGELELLRHATLDGLRAIVIEFHPGVYGTRGMQECKAILRKAGFRRRDSASSRLVWTCVRATAEEGSRLDPSTPPQPAGGWASTIVREEDALIVPPQARSFVQKTGVLSADGAYLPQSALWRRERLLTRAPSRPQEAPDELAGTWLWGGMLFKNFAHFITESTTRLWALDQVDLTKLDGVVFAPKSPSEGDHTRALHTEFLRLMGVDCPIKVVSQPTTVETLLIPGQGFGLGSIAEGTDAFRAAFQTRFGAEVSPDGPERLYISRSKLGSDRGSYLGETEIEAHLAAQGYEIFHPQDHDLTTQIARYKAARQIIAAEGSALHLLAFVARSHQRIAMILRRRSSATAVIERHLAGFTGHAPLTLDVVKRVWAPTGTRRKRHHAAELSMSSLQSSLVQAGFVAPGPTWPELSADHITRKIGRKYRAAA